MNLNVVQIAIAAAFLSVVAVAVHMQGGVYRPGQNESKSFYVTVFSKLLCWVRRMPCMVAPSIILKIVTMSLSLSTCSVTPIIPLSCALRRMNAEVPVVVIPSVWNDVQPWQVWDHLHFDEHPKDIAH